MQTKLWAIILVLLGSIVGSYGSLLFKKGSANLSKNILSNLKNKTLITGFTIYCLSASIYIIALKGGELSVLYPLVGTTYIWSSLFAITLLKEKMNTLKWLGILAIIVGITFIGVGS